MTALTTRFSQIFSTALRSLQVPTTSERLLSTSAALSAGYDKPNGPRNFLRYNKTMFPPQTLEETPRPAVR